MYEFFLDLSLLIVYLISPKLCLIPALAILPALVFLAYLVPGVDACYCVSLLCAPPNPHTWNVVSHLAMWFPP